MSTPSFHIIKTPLDRRQLLVEASAGTGKTFALTGLVVRLVLEEVELPKILVVTFTNAATDELKTRIRSRLREILVAIRNPEAKCSDDAADFRKEYASYDKARMKSVQLLEKALLDVDEASVYTIHGFCQRVLQQSAFESGAPFEAEFTEDAAELLDRAIADFWHRHTFDDPWTAALAVEAKASELRNHYKDAGRYPNTRIEPAAIPLAEAIHRLKEEASRLCEAWDDRKDVAKELLADTVWTLQGAFQDGAVLEATFAELDDKLQATPHDCTALIDRLSIDTLLKGAGKRGKTQKARRDELAQEPLFEVCRSFSEAFAEAQRSLIHAYIQEVRHRFDELKLAAGVLTFDDLLHRLHAALRPESENRGRLLAAIRKRWSHALIDEFQDTDPIQYEIFQTCFEGRLLVFVGDPKQAIYSFRGADLFAYLRAKEDTERVGEGARYMLDRNWRSSTGLVEAVNELFSRPIHPFVIEGVPYERIKSAGKADERPLEGDGLPPLVWWAVPDDGSKNGMNKPDATALVVQGVVAGMKQLLASGATIGGRPVSPSDIAVLVRTNNEGQAVQQALGEAGIPAVVSRSGDIWQSKEVADVEHLLRAFLRPSDRSAICTALATDLWGMDAAAIHARQQDDEEMDALRLALHQYQQLWQNHGVLRAITQLIEDNAVTERLLTFTDGERRLTNVRHALELLHEEESRHNRGPEELVQWLRARESRIVEDRETSELRLETDAAAVQIVTIHKSKGLQYDIVFAPFLWSAKQKHKDGQCVLVHEKGEVVYDIGSERAEDRRRVADAERLSEDLRLAYVALTRAVHRCYVAWGPINQAECSPLAYLLHGHAASGDSISERAANGFSVAKTELMNARAELDSLASAHPELMTVVDLPTEAPSVESQVRGPETFEPRVLSEEARKRLVPWSITSFSQLTRNDDHRGTSALEDGPRKGIFAFAAGTEAGSCLHEIIEEADLSPLATSRNGADVPPELIRLVQRKLEAFGLDQSDAHRGGDDFDPEAEVIAMMKRLAAAPIPNAACTLAEVDPARALREWSFVLPVDSITGIDLANAIAEFGPDGLRAPYSMRVRDINPEAINGFLTGIADFTFENGGRWFVLDWKSTHLGTHPDDYDQDQLSNAAQERHYVLQLMIYTLGLHRYLQTRMASYDYDTHIGGAGVVFLRGVDGTSDRGFYVLRPRRELIEAMDAMLTPVPA